MKVILKHVHFEEKGAKLLVPPYTVKKISRFPSSDGKSLTRLSLGKNNLIIPAQGEFGK